eukprot:evm.model.scf_2827.1 EVM.evm.TU.scf_2827.1   scf_2827:7153-8524(-)
MRTMKSNKTLARAIEIRLKRLKEVMKIAAKYAEHAKHAGEEDCEISSLAKQMMHQVQEILENAEKYLVAYGKKNWLKLFMHAGRIRSWLEDWEKEISDVLEDFNFTANHKLIFYVPQSGESNKALGLRFMEKVQSWKERSKPGEYKEALQLRIQAAAKHQQEMPHNVVGLLPVVQKLQEKL